MKEGEGGGAKNNETNFIFSPFSVPLRLVVGGGGGGGGVKTGFKILSQTINISIVNELLVRFQIVNILLTKRGPYYKLYCILLHENNYIIYFLQSNQNTITRNNFISYSTYKNFFSIYAIHFGKYLLYRREL